MPHEIQVECLHRNHMYTHFAANPIMQTCRRPTIWSKQFACFIKCNYYFFCSPIQTGRLERQDSLQDFIIALGSFDFRDTKGTME